MNTPCQRQLVILVILKDMVDGKKFTISEIARNHSVAERTVYRYIKNMQLSGWILEKDFDNRWFIFQPASSVPQK